MTRALLFGDQAVLGGDDVARLYARSRADGKDGGSLNKIDVLAIASSRIDALRNRLADELESTAKNNEVQRYELLDTALARLKEK